MNGELAQYFALATYGSARLRGGVAAVPGGWARANGSFQITGSVDFGGVDSVDGWLERLSARGVQRVWLAVPDLQSSADAEGVAWYRRTAFAGGIAAGVLTTSAAGNELWQASWLTAGPDATDRRWRVTYQCTRAAFGPERPAVADAAAALDAVLGRAAAFAAGLGLDNWDAIFTKARRLWAARPTRRRSAHRDLFPDGCYDEASRRLVAMVQAAWVFGGMGSWNDLGFPGAAAAAEYDEISADLYANLMRCCLASANADL